MHYETDLKNVSLHDNPHEETGFMQRRSNRKVIGDNDERTYTQPVAPRTSHFPSPFSLHTLHLESELENLISQSGGHGV